MVRLGAGLKAHQAWWQLLTVVIVCMARSSES
jgi:hypothetical protein